MEKLTLNEILIARNKVFISKGIPTLINKGFQKSPFKTSWYGKERSDYLYCHCKLINDSLLICLETYIMKGDNWIQNYINIFKLEPSLENLKQLENSESMKFGMPPLVQSRMRLKIDGYKKIPMLVDLMIKQHKIGNYYSRTGFNKQIEKLGNLIQQDFNNIDYFIELWFENHKPLTTTWNGDIVGLELLSPKERLVHTDLLKMFHKSNLEDKVKILKWLKLDNTSIENYLNL